MHREFKFPRKSLKSQNRERKYTRKLSGLQQLGILQYSHDKSQKSVSTIAGKGRKSWIFGKKLTNNMIWTKTVQERKWKKKNT